MGHMMKEVTPNRVVQGSANPPSWADEVCHTPQCQPPPLKEETKCPLCGDWQTLIHTLNNSKVALDQRR